MYKYLPVEKLEKAASCLTGNYRLNYYWCTMMSKTLRYTGSHSFDAHEVLPGVYLGDIYAAHNIDELKRRNITHVIDAALAIVPPFPDQFKYMHVELLDYPGENVMPYLEHTSRFIEQALASGGKVLVHCLKGVSRSATIAAAYAIYSQKLSTKAAIQLLRKSRTVVCPNHGFQMQLEWYEKSLSKKANFAHPTSAIELKVQPVVECAA